MSIFSLETLAKVKHELREIDSQLDHGNYEEWDIHDAFSKVCSVFVKYNLITDYPKNFDELINIKIMEWRLQMYPLLLCSEFSNQLGKFSKKCQDDLKDIVQCLKTLEEIEENLNYIKDNRSLC